MASFFEATFPSDGEKIRIKATTFVQASRKAFQVFSRKNSVLAGTPIDFSIQKKDTAEQKKFVGTKILDNRPVKDDASHDGIPVLHPYNIKVEEKN